MKSVVKLQARTLFYIAAEKWLAHILRFTYRTQIHYRMIINRFLFYAPVYLEDLSSDHIERYVQHVISKYTNRCANSHLTGIKSFCRYSAERYNLPNPAQKVKMLPEDPPRQRVISSKELRKILAVCEGDEKDIILFLANTGLRSTELQSLQPANISSNGKMLIIIGKGRKKRVIPLNKTCQAILAKNVTVPCLGTNHNARPNPFNFLESYRKRNTLYFLCKRLSICAGIPIAGPHAYRHYFATRMLQNAPIHLVSKVLGHADTRTTELIYYHFQAEKELLGLTDCLDE